MTEIDVYHERAEQERISKYRRSSAIRELTELPLPMNLPASFNVFEGTFHQSSPYAPCETSYYHLSVKYAQYSAEFYVWEKT